MCLNRPWLWLILVLALAARTYHVGYPPWDYHNWRQSITLMVAHDIAQHPAHALCPDVAWTRSLDPTATRYFSAELSIQSWLAALLYKTIRESDTLARLVVIALSLLGIGWLYELVDRSAGTAAATFSAVVYAVLPYHVFFGRVFMPDIPAIAFALGGLNYLDRWTGDRRRAILIAAAVLSGFAVLQKLTVIFIGLPLFYLFRHASRKASVRPDLYLFAAIAGVPVLAWYVHSVAIAPLSSFTMDRGLFARHLELWFQAGFFSHVLQAAWKEAFSPVGCMLMLAGLVWPSPSRVWRLFLLWLLGAAMLLASIPAIFPGNFYYLTLLLPGGAALGGLVLARIARGRAGLAASIVVLITFTATAVRSAVPLYEPDRALWDLGILLKGLTAEDDLIATETGGNPSVLYASGRRGWLLFREYNVARIEQLRRAGARYYADAFTKDVDQQPEFFRAMDARFERLTPHDAPWAVYRLDTLTVRRLLGWPASLEVRCHCRVLQVTDSAGRIVYRSEFAGGRHLIVLPSHLAPGKYRIEADERSAGIEVPDPPRYGWFRP